MTGLSRAQGARLIGGYEALALRKAYPRRKFPTRCTPAWLGWPITPEFFDRQAHAWRLEQERLQRKIEEGEAAAPAPIDAAIDMLGLTSQASELFLQQNAVEQRRL